MRLVINTLDGGNLDIADFDASSLMQMLEDWEDINILTFALDTGTAYIPKASITRIDSYDEE